MVFIHYNHYYNKFNHFNHYKHIIYSYLFQPPWRLEGLCPASHGHNVAQIAGLPEKVGIRRRQVGMCRHSSGDVYNYIYMCVCLLYIYIPTVYYVYIYTSHIYMYNMYRYIITTCLWSWLLHVYTYNTYGTYTYAHE